MELPIKYYEFCLTCSIVELYLLVVRYAVCTSINCVWSQSKQTIYTYLGKVLIIIIVHEYQEASLRAYNQSRPAVILNNFLQKSQHTGPLDPLWSLIKVVNLFYFSYRHIYIYYRCIWKKRVKIKKESSTEELIVLRLDLYVLYQKTSSSWTSSWKKNLRMQ